MAFPANWRQYHTWGTSDGKMEEKMIIKKLDVWFTVGPVPLHPDDGKNDMLRCLFLDVEKLSYKALILSNSFSECCFVALLDFPSAKNSQPCLHLDVPGS